MSDVVNITPKGVEEKNDYRLVTISLSERERAAMADEAAILEEQIDFMKESHKEIRKEQDQSVKDIDDRRRQLMKDIRKRKAERLLECMIRKDFTNGIFQMIRKDTGEVVEERALNSQERQTAFVIQRDN